MEFERQNPAEPESLGPGAEEGFEREQEEAARVEAAEIGGRASVSEDRVDEAQRAPREGGGGDAEGFEEAERELVEHASHGDPAPSPERLAPRVESENPESQHGEADHVKSAEREEE
jgi:hypothetical protein